MKNYLLKVSYFVEVLSKNFMSWKSTTLKQWFLRCCDLPNHVITENFGIPNRLCNVPVEDLGCLTCLLQSMAKIVQEEIENKSKLVKVLLHRGIGGHCDRWMKLFGCLKRCSYDGLIAVIYLMFVSSFHFSPIFPFNTGV